MSCSRVVQMQLLDPKRISQSSSFRRLPFCLSLICGGRLLSPSMKFVMVSSRISYLIPFFSIARHGSLPSSKTSSKELEDANVVAG